MCLAGVGEILMQTLPELALQHVIQKLASQQQYVSQIRSQAAISAAISGLVATFFAALLSNGLENLKGEVVGLTVPGALGFLFLAASLYCSSMVVIHFHDFTFGFDGIRMLELSKALRQEEFFEKYVNDGEWFFADNEKKIEIAQRYLWFALVLAWVQLLPWLIVTVRVING